MKIAIKFNAESTFASQSKINLKTSGDLSDEELNHTKLTVYHRWFIKRGLFCKRHTPHCPVLRDVGANLGERCFGKREAWGIPDIFVLRVPLLATGLTSGRFPVRLSTL